jgi:ribosomal protein S18 acetylase RimI-like enzyme
MPELPRQNHPAAASIVSLRSRDLPRVVEVLARAFRDNALNRATVRSIRSDDRLRSNRHGMRALLPVAQRYGRVLVANLDGAVAGSLVAVPPDGFPLPPPALMRRLRCLIGQGWRTALRWGEVFDALEAFHPKGPHCYLGTLGVDPAQQSRGVGGGLLAAWLREVDQQSMPAYLETDGPGNIGFYERAGFAVQGEMVILGVSVWRMHRPARAASPK